MSPNMYNLPEYKSHHDQVVFTVLLLYECHVNDITSRCSLYSDTLFTFYFYSIYLCTNAVKFKQLRLSLSIVLLSKKKCILSYFVTKKYTQFTKLGRFQLAKVLPLNYR